MKKIFLIFKNRYLLTLALFVLYNLFINNIDIPFIISSRWELHKLRNQAVQVEKEKTKKQLLIVGIAAASLLVITLLFISRKK